MNRMSTASPAYGVALLQDVRMGPPIVEYLERIDATLAPYGGHFIVHGATPEILEGTSPGTMVVIEFPDRPRHRVVRLACLPGDPSAADRQLHEHGVRRRGRGGGPSGHRCAALRPHDGGCRVDFK
jgi:uncharacterized protein (DUF1330 family)